MQFFFNNEFKVCIFSSLALICGERARGWGIGRQVRKKLQIPGGMPGGGWFRIEPCIMAREPSKKNFFNAVNFD